MKSFSLKQACRLEGKVVLPGDKSIAHRSIIVSALSRGKTRIQNFPLNKDCLYTIGAFKKLGIKIDLKNTAVTVSAKGRYGLCRPKDPIFVGDSGTTLRLILGVLAGQNFRVKLTAGKSLSCRPMRRVTQPLRMMGAHIIAKSRERRAKSKEEYPPITIRGGHLKPITYKMPVASAQVKSALLFAGLYSQGITRIIEPMSTRDHTERLLKLFKAEIKLKENEIVIKGGRELISPRKIYIPGDLSSAGFFMVAAAIIPGSKVRIKKVSLNPSRAGMIRVLRRMGADIQVLRNKEQALRFEPMGDIIIKGSKLKGIRVKRAEIPSLIDELPILAVAASVAQGRTIFAGVGELRLKETDRIKSISQNLKKMGAEIKVVKTRESENMIIRGTKALKGAKVSSFGDHRTAMSMVVAGLKAEGKTLIDDVGCINKSFPDFLFILRRLLQ